ncbi:CaiB/BaiF CoA transferase family protein [Ramlibacter montanisoli]|uniref:CoA transferase n=1 Tax=Ramlibacter montanisoli TaxID=2732512 RepID=A0A849KD18_9BURK|nr:CoA transferase [Ramlibacter montanisoli]NNU42641.1 CoA transferase [Ramlibacter montanisoli]
MPLPLEGIRVLDLTNVMAGPYCTMVLGDLGAEVIKLESLDGDSTRNFEPKVNDESYCFAVLNRNKKSISVDMKAAEGKAIVMMLAAQADIMIENFRPGVVKKLGVGYEDVKKVNPGIIYASMSGFGQTGPYGKKGGFDIIAQGMSGIMMMTGHPGGRPAKVGIAMNDIACGVTTLYGILGALIGKLRHGQGQYLETSLLEAGLAWSIWEFGAWFGGGEKPTATGTRHRRSAPYQAFRSKDGYVTVGASGDKLWRAFVEQVVNRPEWLQDPRFEKNPLRVKNVEALQELIESVLVTQPTAHWVEKLDAAGVPGGPVYTYDQTLSDPQVQHRRMVYDIDHPKIGAMKTLGLPVKSSGELTEIRKPAPLHGQHTEEVLRAVGYSEAQVRSLLAEGVVKSTGVPA